MRLTADTVELALVQAGVPESRACRSVRDAIGILQALRDTASWWRPWLKLGLGIAIGGLQLYLDARCPGPVP